MIYGTVTADAEVVRYLGAVPARVREQVGQSIARLVLRLQRKVKQEKLTGKVLKVRTGTLRRSIDQRVISDGVNIAGIVSTNVKYGIRHEYGFQGQEQVKAHLRSIKKAFGRSISPRQVSVRAHTRELDLPASSFLRTSLREMQGQIVADLDRAVAAGLKQR